MKRLTDLPYGTSGTDKFGTVWFRVLDGAIVHHDSRVQVFPESVARTIRVTEGPQFQLEIK